MMRYTVLLVTAVLLSGCSLFEEPTFTTPNTPNTPVAESSGTVADESDVLPTERQLPPLRPATVTLIKEAEAEMAAGQPGIAGAALENAVRIDPDHPQPWLALARLRLQEGDIRQAELLARRALNLSPADTEEAKAANALLVRIQSMAR
ncbi:MAG: tetratricopeptide repeat protein [Pseudomonadota bacterium]